VAAEVVFPLEVASGEVKGIEPAVEAPK